MTENVNSRLLDDITYTKLEKKECIVKWIINGHRRKYNSPTAAQTACTTNVLCSAVYGITCDGSSWYLCLKGYPYGNSAVSCVYEKQKGSFTVAINDGNLRKFNYIYISIMLNDKTGHE